MLLLSLENGIKKFIANYQVKNILFIGDATSFSVASRVFQTVPKNIVIDSNNAWDNINNHYVCPLTGNYLCLSQLRPTDNSGYFSYYQNTDITNTDNPFGLWVSSANGLPSNRNGNFVSRVIKCNAGDRLRHVAYLDKTGNTTCSSSISIVYLGR